MINAYIHCKHSKEYDPFDNWSTLIQLEWIKWVSPVRASFMMLWCCYCFMGCVKENTTNLFNSYGPAKNPVVTLKEIVPLHSVCLSLSLFVQQTKRKEWCAWNFESGQKSQLKRTEMAARKRRPTAFIEAIETRSPTPTTKGVAPMSRQAALAKRRRWSALHPPVGYPTNPSSPSLSLHRCRLNWWMKPLPLFGRNLLWSVRISPSLDWALISNTVQ